jgi:hypothetical protein
MLYAILYFIFENFVISLFGMSGIGIDSSETVLIKDNPELFTYIELLELITPSY